MSALPPVAAWLLRAGGRAGARLGARALVAFAFHAAFLDLWSGVGFVGAVASPLGLALLAVAGLAFLAGAAGALAAARAGGAALRAAPRVATLAGAGLALVGLTASLVLRDARTVVVVEGDRLAPGTLAGAPALSFGRVTLLPHGPHVLSKTVEIAASAAGQRAAVGLFPPTTLAGWNLSVYKYGYAPSIAWTRPDGRGRREQVVALGTLPHDEDEASLVTWTPETNVMMGAGTFPPRLEELASVAPDVRVFLRLVSARVGGVERDLRDPEAYRWLADGRLEDPTFHVQVLLGRERIHEGAASAGGRVETPAGTLDIAADVPLFVELLATRDPWLPWGASGLGLLAVGLVARLGGWITRTVRAATARRREPAGATSSPATR